jgi:poly-beta-1,6-N-acetyl-D-glucosamine synthase
MKKGSDKPWPTLVNSNYQPKISIIVPTYNESKIIRFKLANLSKLRYPSNLLETIIVDSNSSDGTIEILKQFCEENSQSNTTLLIEEKRKGKSHALNYALSRCGGEVVIVSDADCFWPSDILEKAMPFLADPAVGLIGGPKILLNSDQTWVTRMEQEYLKSANFLRLGESKVGSTVFFEGGFSAFKKNAIDKFDPYGTGSDDCGTAINVIENNYRAMLVPDAKFYSTFPLSLKNKLSVKLRRINQLMHVFAKYFDLILKGKIKSTKRTVIPNILLYLFSPIFFVFFLGLTGLLVFSFPYLLMFSLLLFVPVFRFYVYQIVENNFMLVAALLGVMSGKVFSVWSQPEDRALLTRDLLNEFELI